MHNPRQPLGNTAVGVTHFGGQRRRAVADIERTPHADDDLPVGALLDPVERHRIDRLAADAQRHRLSRQMLDRDADRLGARIVVGLGEQPGDSRRLTGQPVALGTRRRRATGGGRTCNSLAFRTDRIDPGLGAEIDAKQRAALPVHETRDRAARTARICGAVGGNAPRSQCRRVDLDDMRARQHAFEMIAPVFVGHGVAAVLEHDADAGDPLGRPGVDRARAIGDTTDDRQPVADAVTRDPHHRIGDRALRSTAVAGLRPVHRLPGGRIGAHLEQIGDDHRGARSERPNRDAEAQPIRTNRIGYQPAICSNRGWLETHCRRQQVGHRYRTGCTACVAVGHDDPVLDAVAGNRDRD